MSNTTQILKLNDVIAMTKRSKSSIRREIINLTFPPSFKIGARTNGWRLSDIEQWIEDRKNGIIREYGNKNAD